MRAVFLSDVHLKDPEGADYERLIRFFDRLRGRRISGSGEISDATLTLDQLVIAGDFFDFWFSKGDAIYPGFRPIVDRMVALKQEGAEFHFDGLRVLASHGDTVDAGNHSYLALRSFLRSSLTRRAEQRLPRSLTWRLARFWSKMSREARGESREKMVEAMHRFAMGKIQEGYDAVILGHCHEPLLQQVSRDGREKTF